MAKSSGPHDKQLKTLFDFGLRYPGAHVKSPWPGHRDLAVKDKTFAYLSVPGEALRVSCKLPASCGEALRLPFTAPTEYGLGKSGWVSAQFEAGDDVPVDMLLAWIDESYRAQAPKRLSAAVPPLEPGSLMQPEVELLSARKKPPAAAKRPVRSTPRATRGARKKGRSFASGKAAPRASASKKSSPRKAEAAKRPRRKATAAERG